MHTSDHQTKHHHPHAEELTHDQHVALRFLASGLEPHDIHGERTWLSDIEHIRVTSADTPPLDSETLRQGLVRGFRAAGATEPERKMMATDMGVYMHSSLIDELVRIIDTKGLSDPTKERFNIKTKDYGRKFAAGFKAAVNGEPEIAPAAEQVAAAAQMPQEREETTVGAAPVKLTLEKKLDKLWDITRTALHDGVSFEVFVDTLGMHHDVGAGMIMKLSRREQGHGSEHDRTVPTKDVKSGMVRVFLETRADKTQRVSAAEVEKNLRFTSEGLWVSEPFVDQMLAADPDKLRGAIVNAFAEKKYGRSSER